MKIRQIPPFLFFFLWALGVSATPCGGPYERACCTLALEFANSGGACDWGQVEMGKCEEGTPGDCICNHGAGFLGIPVRSSGICVPISPCGAEGERACCFGERLTTCDPGLHEVTGCVGNCACGHNNGNIKSNGRCYRPQFMSEPQVNWTAAQPSGSGCELRGYADIHMHLFADIAHGGGVLHGSACPRVEGQLFCDEAYQGQIGLGDCSTSYCDAEGVTDVNVALSSCHATYHDLRTKSGGYLSAPAPAPFGCPLHDPACGNKVDHMNHTFGETPIATGTRDPGRGNLGAPLFNGWPHASSTVHQQAYYKWLERAWRGGLRLIVQMAVNNTALCRTNNRLSNVDCSDSMASIDQQLQAAYDFQDYIDQVSGGTGQGWFRIVRSPIEARQVVGEGKLAVVLGIEVDHLFNCKFPASQCTRTLFNELINCNFTTDTIECKDPENPGLSSAQWIQSQVDYYYDEWGVRHIFPVHNFDNSFGGTATWNATVELGNRDTEGHWYKTKNCATDYGADLSNLGTAGSWFTNLFGFGNVEPVPYRGYPTCNQFGLFPLGEVLIDRLMSKGMLIDIDHMSAQAITDVIEYLTSQEQSYPLVASHVLPKDLYAYHGRHERMRSQQHLNKIALWGGIVGLMLKDDHLDESEDSVYYDRKTLQYPGSSIKNDCSHSSTTFAQAYLYGVDQTNGRIALGSDFNGIAGHFGPRFGQEACGLHYDQIQNQYHSSSPLQYPFQLDQFGTLDKQVSGQRTFDYNYDGLAHVGLIPDLIADIQHLGLTAQQLDPLFRSAESYIQAWERAAREPVRTGCYQCQWDDETPPVLSCPPHQTVTCSGDLTAVSFTPATATDDCELLTQPQCTLSTNASLPPGSHQVECVAYDTSNHEGTCSFNIHVVDMNPPILDDAPKPITVECESSQGTRVLLPIPGVSDQCDSDPSLTNDAPDPFPPYQSTLVTWTARDDYGLSSTTQQIVTVIDTQPPQLSPTRDIILECNHPDGAIWKSSKPEAWDLCDKDLEFSIDAPWIIPLGQHHYTWSARDNAGNSASTPQAIEVVDTTPPYLSCPRDRVIFECSEPNGMSSNDIRFNEWRASLRSSDQCSDSLQINMSTPNFFSVDTVSQVHTSVTDDQGLSTQCLIDIVVQDTTAPQITSLTLTPDVLWPKNRQFVTITTDWVADDICDQNLTYELVSVSSSDGEIDGDVQLSPNGEIQLRATHSPSAFSRIYTLQYKVFDDAGNHSRITKTVIVPESLSHASSTPEPNPPSHSNGGQGDHPPGRSVVKPERSQSQTSAQDAQANKPKQAIK